MSSSARTRRRAHQARLARNKARQRNLLIGGAVGLAAIVFLVWLVGNTVAGTSVSSVKRVDVEGSNVGEIAPNFTVPTLDGGTFTLADHRGKPTVVFFMAYWCGTCVPEARALAQLRMEYGEAINVIAIDIDPSSTPDSLRQFKRAAGDGAFTWAFDQGQRVTQSYQVASLDTTLIIDGDGYIVYRDGVPTSYGTLNREIKKLISWQDKP